MSPEPSLVLFTRAVRASVFREFWGSATVYAFLDRKEHCLLLYRYEEGDDATSCNPIECCQAHVYCRARWLKLTILCLLRGICLRWLAWEVTGLTRDPPRIQTPPELTWYAHAPTTHLCAPHNNCTIITGLRDYWYLVPKASVSEWAGYQL
jgi:hypothetical protein